jgi:hypothetical protein
MVVPNQTPDVEPIPGPLPGAAPGGRRPRWWRRAAAYALRRGADRLQRRGRRRTAAGQGRALVRERRARLLGGVSA